MEITPFQLAQRYIGIKELSIEKHDHPLIQWWLSLCGFDLSAPDETPWCSAFVNGIAWELRLPRSKSAAARSWLTVGTPIAPPAVAVVGYDVVVLQRGSGEQPGPEVISAPGHVGFFAGYDRGNILILGGNQGNQISIQPFPIPAVLRITRLFP